MAEKDSVLQEEWRPVQDFEGFYSASPFGYVRRDAPGHGKCQPGAVLRPQPTKRGYLRVKLSRPGKTSLRFVHQIIAAAFLGPRPKDYEVNHKDLNKLNNRVDNLEYLSQPDHVKHTRKHGRYQYSLQFAMTKKAIAKRSGKKHHWHRKPETLEKISGDKHWTHKDPEAAKVHAAHMNATRQIARGTRSGVARFDAEQIVDIRRRFDCGESTAYQLAKEYRCKWDTVKAIVERRSYTEVPEVRNGEQ